MATDQSGHRSRHSSGLDPATVEAARTGDRRAWSVVIRRYQTLILSIFMGFSIAHPRAVEMGQELWLKLYLRARKGLIEILTLPGLAVREARFRALDELRGQRRAGPMIDLEDVVLEASTPSLEERASRKAELALVQKMLLTLPPRQRQVMLLAGVRGTPHAEVARELGISTVRAKQTLSDARQRLRRIRALPEPVQRAYLFVSADGLPADATAERMGISRTQLHDYLSQAGQHIKHGGLR
jgi:RNA polymerase sigma-70 factor (ECF subfamily)